MYVYCVYPAISKGPIQLPNCLKIAETSVVLNVFKGVIIDVNAYIVFFFSVGPLQDKTYYHIKTNFAFHSITSCLLTSIMNAIYDIDVIDHHHHEEIL